MGLHVRFGNDRLAFWAHLSARHGAPWMMSSLQQLAIIWKKQTWERDVGLASESQIGWAWSVMGSMDHACRGEPIKRFFISCFFVFIISMFPVFIFQFQFQMSSNFHIKSTSKQNSIMQKKNNFMLVSCLLSHLFTQMVQTIHIT